MNLHPAGVDELMHKTLATATDRLLHHAHICQASGDSVLLTQALTGKGVSPFELDPRMASPASRWADPLAITGHFCWPPVGRIVGRRWAETDGP